MAWSMHFFVDQEKGTVSTQIISDSMSVGNYEYTLDDPGMIDDIVRNAIAFTDDIDLHQLRLWKPKRGDVEHG